MNTDLHVRTGQRGVHAVEPGRSAAHRANSTGPSFAHVLAEQMRSTQGVKFSAHATQRLAERHIALSQREQQQLETAVEQAAAKGARETLLLMDKLAFVVSVPNRTVITAMASNELGTTVFTNIDSAVVVAPEAPATAAMSPHSTL